MLEEEGEIMAHAFVHLIPMIPKPNRMEDHFGYLTNVYTKPGFRNQGLGGKLLNHIKLWAVEEDLEISTIRDNERCRTSSAEFAG